MTKPLTRRVKLVWAIPVAALLIGGYLAVTTLARRGPEVVITFATAHGLSAGTKVAHKDVQLGTVTAVALAPDLSHVDASVRMTSDAAPYLTDKARFWVVRPSVSGGSVSGLTTLLSGSYIEMDPGPKGGAEQTRFTGLENPPGLRSDQPGTTFTLHAPTVASLGTGTPVFYRDVRVGEVLSHAISEGTAAITAEVFVRAPYDARVRTGSVWWQASGISAGLEQKGIRVEVTSVQAALSGGVAFNVPPQTGKAPYPVAAAGTSFPLFSDEAAAYRASREARLNFVVFFNATARGLAAGSPVQLYGRRVGDVTEVRVTTDGSATPRVRVTLDVLPSSLTGIGATPIVADAALGAYLVQAGLQGDLVTLSYVTGAQAISLDFSGTRRVGPPGLDDGIMILPNTGGGGGSMLDTASGFLAKMQHVPFQSMGNAVGGAFAAATAMLGGLNADKQARALTATLGGLQATIQRADASLGPILQGLPAQADGVQRQLAAANQALASADQSYGSGSDTADSLSRRIAGYYDTIRRIRLLADYLVRHPEAIARGTTASGTEH